MNECRESVIDNRIDNRQPNRNSLSTGVVRVKNATTAVNNRVTRVRSLRIAEGTRSGKTHLFINRCTHSSIAAPIHQSLHPFINRCTHSSIAAPIHQSLHPFINRCTHPSIAAPIHQSLHSSINRCTHSSIATLIHQSLHSLINQYSIIDNRIEKWPLYRRRTRQGCYD